MFLVLILLLLILKPQNLLSKFRSKSDKGTVATLATGPVLNTTLAVVLVPRLIKEYRALIVIVVLTNNEHSGRVTRCSCS